MNRINFSRENIHGYSPLNLRSDIHIVGCGSVGSKICQGLFQLGLPQNDRQVHLYDFDRAESHNISNQVYGKEHIGMLKVEALKSIIHRMCDIDERDLVAHADRVNRSTPISGIVISTPDNIEGRRDTVKGTSRFQVEWWIDCRMSTNMGYVMCIKNTPTIVGKYEKTYLMDIPPTPESTTGCGVPSVGPVSSLLASIACWNIRTILSGKEPDQITIPVLDPMSITVAKL